jgi:uncharacterized membrane protein YphA (DoxX/SURF4 family)
LRRLYSTFADSWPGIGLLLMRVVAGSVLVVHAGPALWSHPPLQATLAMSVMVSGVLLIAGLWTPPAGMVVAVIEIAQLLITDRNSVVCLLAGTIGGALAMLGPGRWSVDARLFGWKRIDPSPRGSSPNAF